jgi:hypothetical protein
MEDLSLRQKVGVAIAVAPTILMFGPLPLVLMSGDFFMRQIVKHKLQDNNVKVKPR